MVLSMSLSIIMHQSLLLYESWLLSWAPDIVSIQETRLLHLDLMKTLIVRSMRQLLLLLENLEYQNLVVLSWRYRKFSAYSSLSEHQNFQDIILHTHDVITTLLAWINLQLDVLESWDSRSPISKSLRIILDICDKKALKKHWPIVAGQNRHKSPKNRR